MTINIQIKKKDLFLLIAIMIFIAGITIVISQNGTTSWQVHGHDETEIEDVATQTWVETNFFEKGSSENTITYKVINGHCQNYNEQSFDAKCITIQDCDSYSGSPQIRDSVTPDNYRYCSGTCPPSSKTYQGLTESNKCDNQAEGIYIPLN